MAEGNPSIAVPVSTGEEVSNVREKVVDERTVENYMMQRLLWDGESVVPDERVRVPLWSVENRAIALSGEVQWSQKAFRIWVEDLLIKELFNSWSLSAVEGVAFAA